MKINLTPYLAATVALVAAVSVPAYAERAPVLKQIQVPHDYYFREMYLPQLTTGPSALAWSPDAQWLVYSMQGSLWRQRTDSTVAEQLTSGPGYDYQPDWSPDGSQIVFVRYLDDAMELQLLELASGEVSALTRGGAVNVEPRWSPEGSRLAFVSTSGTGRFHVFVGELAGKTLSAQPLVAERRSAVARYYYGEYDHELSPSWSPDGEELIYLSNPEVRYGTGSLWRRSLEPDAEPALVRREETTWKTRPDWSPDGGRVIYASYLGRQWHQLWVTAIAGDAEPFPLTYGDYDITAPRWSPDGDRIAYISNEAGNTAIWIQQTVGGRRTPLVIAERRYRVPVGKLTISVSAAGSTRSPARISALAADGRSYAPDDAWMHADDSFDRDLAAFETHYFHADGEATLTLPAGTAQVRVWRGLEHRIEQRTVDITANMQQSLAIALKPLEMPSDWPQWRSGDVHVHMNYGGSYRNTPRQQVRQAAAEDLDLVFNLVVNKEQRIPDIAYFSTAPDPASTPRVLLTHAQEFHTSFWGHLGLLGLTEHYLLPDYAAYAGTGAASLFPDNASVADIAHAQRGVVGYVHPFLSEPNPADDAALTNALPVDAALGNVDYYEVVGFADHRASAAVWHRLLNCGMHIAAAGGSDTMANYASLRGPVGLNRVYVTGGDAGATPEARRDTWLAGLRAGRSKATNGPLLGFTLNGELPGATLTLAGDRHQLHYRGFLRSIVPVDHLEVVMNGEVVERIDLDGERTRADIEGTLAVTGSGWVLLRAWNDGSTPQIFDLYPYATTSPVYIDVAGQPLRCGGDADYFIAWIERLRAAAAVHPDYNSPAERDAVLTHLAAARRVFEQRR